MDPLIKSQLLYQLSYAPFAIRVMPGLVPGIHVLASARKAWMAATSPAMTTR